MVGDAEVHWICPQQIDDAIASGLTTMYGGGAHGDQHLVAAEKNLD